MLNFKFITPNHWPRQWTKKAHSKLLTRIKPHGFSIFVFNLPRRQPLPHFLNLWQVEIARHLSETPVGKKRKCNVLT